jgi:hypothetical protein
MPRFTLPDASLALAHPQRVHGLVLADAHAGIADNTETLASARADAKIAIAIQLARVQMALVALDLM